MRRSVLFLTIVLAACADGPAPTGPDEFTPAMAATAETVSTTEPVNLGVFVQCALDGAGETVLLSGSLHVVTRFVSNDAGVFIVAAHYQPQGVVGIGMTSGDRYSATGVTSDRFRARAGETYTFINNFRIIGPGRGNNYTIHENVHLTFTAQGGLTADVDNYRADCS